MCRNPCMWVKLCHCICTGNKMALGGSEMEQGLVCQASCSTSFQEIYTWLLPLLRKAAMEDMTTFMWILGTHSNLASHT